MTKIECNLCGQPFDLDDICLDIRIERHEEKHKRGRHHNKNEIEGKVKWKISKKQQ